MCLFTHKHRFSISLSGTLQHSKHHVFMLSRLFQPWHINDTSEKGKKHITPCTKCATACHKSTQHKLDRFVSSCHKHTDDSVDSEPVQSCCWGFFGWGVFFVLLFKCATTPLHSTDLPNCSESSVSLLCPIRNTKYTFRLLRGRGYRCLCVQPQHTDWRQNATILRKQSLIIWLRCSSEKTWLPLFGKAEVRFSSTWPAHVCMHMNAVCAYTVWIHTYGHRDIV